MLICYRFEYFESNTISPADSAFVDYQVWYHRRSLCTFMLKFILLKFKGVSKLFFFFIFAAFSRQWWLMLPCHWLALRDPITVLEIIWIMKGGLSLNDWKSLFQFWTHLLTCSNYTFLANWLARHSSPYLVLFLQSSIKILTESMHACWKTCWIRIHLL